MVELETIIKENNQQLLALRNNIQGMHFYTLNARTYTNAFFFIIVYEKQVTENHQEIYRLQDVIRELQSSLTEKSSMIDSQAMSILCKL